MEWSRNFAHFTCPERVQTNNLYHGAASISMSSNGEDALGYSRQARRLSYHAELPHRSTSY